MPRGLGRPLGRLPVGDNGPGFVAAFPGLALQLATEPVDLFPRFHQELTLPRLGFLARLFNDPLRLELGRADLRLCHAAAYDVPDREANRGCHQRHRHPCHGAQGHQLHSLVATVSPSRDPAVAETKAAEHG